MEKQTFIEFLSNYPVFANLTAEEFNKIVEKMEFAEYKKNHLIYKINDRSDKIYFLAKGSIKLSNNADDGRELIKNILHPMAIFGESSMGNQKFRTEQAVCLDDKVTIAYIPVKELRLLMIQNRILANNVIQMLANKLFQTEQKFENLIFKDARSRIIEFMKDSVKKQGRQVGLEMLVKHSLTQQDIANITGTSRQTVTSVLNELRKENLIHFDRKRILIRDMAKLA
jgi:CRP/FNR family cyclic AMP-dependent transcriptional regulator